jgi:hypothetical protein
MARPGDYIPVETKRAVLLHSYGRCEYRGCKKKLVSVDLISGGINEIGVFAHILPVRDGPRAVYKPHFPNIDLNSAANLMLLCTEHHQLIDAIDVKTHTPDILFRMKIDKSNLIGNSITELLELQSIAQPLIEDYKAEYEAAGIIDIFNQARLLGPKDGIKTFLEAQTIMHSLLKNPFFQKGNAAEVLVTTEYYFTQLHLSFRANAWVTALRHVKRALRSQLPDGLFFHLLSCSLTLIRDEYGIFQRKEKLAVIAQLIATMDGKVDAGRNPMGSAFLLLVKSALLRWRGRSEAGPNRRKTYQEAERCCDLSYQLSQNPGCLVQTALINYSTSLTLKIRDAPKHKPLLDRCFVLLESTPLTTFPAAIKYRPRIFRETYRFADSIRAFWEGVEHYRAEFLRTAFVLGEAAVGEHYHGGRADLSGIVDASAFLEEAIGAGYSHDRNVAAYIGCRGVLEPDWFRREVLRKLFDAPGAGITWTTVLQRVRNILYAIQEKDDEPSFGIEEGEFWNTVGTITGRTLKDHATAVRLFQIAERHSEVSGGRFRAVVGLTREYSDLNDRPNYERYLNIATSLAKAYQQDIIGELRAL